MYFSPQPKTERTKLKGQAYLKLKAEVQERDGNTCVNPDCRCKRDYTLPPINYVLTLFHVVHRGRGGSDTKKNTVTCCMHCHDLHHRGKLSNQFAMDYLDGLYPEKNTNV